MMKKNILALLLWIPLFVQAQAVLTPEQRLEKAKQEAKAAKQAVKEAKKAARKAVKLAKKQQTKHDLQPAEQKTIGADTISLTNSSEWIVPQSVTSKQPSHKNQDTKTVKNLSKEADYLAGAVPQNPQGKVVFTLQLDVPQKSANEIYNTVYQYMNELTKEKNQINSRVVLVNPKQHVIVARFCEWLEFSNSFLSLDRTEFYYMLTPKCTEQHLELTLSHIHYDYEKNRPTHLKISAEEWITDEIALNKQKTRLLRLSGKFRKHTIDRKNEIFGQLTELLQ